MEKHIEKVGFLSVGNMIVGNWDCLATLFARWRVGFMLFLDMRVW
jgi:ABC-type uncharacterized transport system permease subunit